MSSMFGGNNNYNASSSQFSGTQIGGGYVGGKENYNNSNNNQPRRNTNYDERKYAQVTIKQINTAPPPQQDESLIIDGEEINQLILIGQIEEINIQTSHTSLKINDCTGSIDVKQWHNDNGDDMPETANLVQGTYIKIFGRTNIFQGRVSISVFKMFPIENFNEITFHFLEAIFAHLTNTVKSQTQFMGNDTQMNNNMNNMNINNNNMNNNNNNNNKNNNNNGNIGGDPLNNDGEYNLNPLQKKIAMIMHEFDHSESGCNIEVVFNKLTNEDINKIRNAVEELTEEGYLYSTIDEVHFKCSSNN